MVHVRMGVAFKQLSVSHPFKIPSVKAAVPVVAGFVEAVSVVAVHATVGHIIESHVLYLTMLGYHVRISTPRITCQVV
jgi:hypothetical protein